MPDQESCQASTGCSAEGRCSLNTDYAVCAALTDDDCGGSDLCSDEGLCVAETDCQDDAQCQIWGACIAGD